MTVRCPRCGTRYRLPPRSKLGSDPTYRCVQCRHVFAADAAAEGPALLDDAASEDAGDEEMTDEPVDDGDERDRLPEDADWSNEPSDSAPSPRRARDDEPDDTETFAFESEEDGRPDADAARRRRRRREADASARDTGPPVRSVARFALRTLLGVALAYGVLSIYLYTHPEAVASLLGRVPLIGGRLADKRLSPASIQLTDVRGEYQRVKGDKLVFVISGTATNTSPMPVKGVQIEGRIVGRDEQRQVVFCGAAPRDVRDLSIREIGLLQTLEPSRDWNLGAGEQTTFLVAFVAPPADLREFAAEVVGVQARPRAAAGV